MILLDASTIIDGLRAKDLALLSRMEISSIVVDGKVCQAAASWDLTPSVN